MADINMKLDAISDVDIDESGTFKYILIEVSSENLKKYIIRGYSWAEYHADIFERVEPGINGLGFQLSCIGGGRIKHEPEKKTILVYGYSLGFGRADHSIAVSKLKSIYSNYQSITFSNDGY